MPSLKSLVLRPFRNSADEPLSPTSKSPTPCELLPVEVLTDIFLYFIPTRWSRSERAVRHALGAVCRKWRSVIINTPEFWNIIGITPGQEASTIYGFERFMERTRVSLSRAGSLPLHVTWDTFHMKKRQTQRILECLSLYGPFERWKTLCLGYVLVDPEKIRCPAEANLRNLESLTVSRESYSWLSNLVEKTAINLRHLEFSSGPNSDQVEYYPESINRVSSLSIENTESFLQSGLPPKITQLRLHSPPGSLPVVQFTHVLHLELDTFMAVDRTLEAFPNVEYIKGTLGEIEDFTAAGVLLPLLRHLDIEITPDSAPSIVCLRAPALTTLCIGQPIIQPRLYDPLALIDMSRVNDLAQLSPTTLIIRCYSEFPTLSAFLQRFPKVEHLTICFRFPKNRNLFAQSLLEDLYPRLVTVRLELAWNKQDVDEWITFGIEILKKRMASGMKSITCVWLAGNEVIVDGTSLDQSNPSVQEG